MKLKNWCKKLFDFFSFQTIKKTLYFGENGIIKNVFHKDKRPININEVDLKRMHQLIKDHMVIKIHLNTLFT